MLSKVPIVEADLSVVKYRHGDTQLMLEYSEPLRIEFKPGTAGSRVRREVKEVKSSKETMKVSRGGEDVEYKSSLLEQKRGPECQNLEGGKQEAHTLRWAFVTSSTEGGDWCSNTKTKIFKGF